MLCTTLLKGASASCGRQTNTHLTLKGDIQEWYVLWKENAKRQIAAACKEQQLSFINFSDLIQVKGGLKG